MKRSTYTALIEILALWFLSIIIVAFNGLKGEDSWSIVPSIWVTFNLYLFMTSKGREVKR